MGVVSCVRLAETGHQSNCRSAGGSRTEGPQSHLLTRSGCGTAGQQVTSLQKGPPFLLTLIPGIWHPGPLGGLREPLKQPSPHLLPQDSPSPSVCSVVCQPIWGQLLTWPSQDAAPCSDSWRIRTCRCLLPGGTEGSRMHGACARLHFPPSSTPLQLGHLGPLSQPLCAPVCSCVSCRDKYSQRP